MKSNPQLWFGQRKLDFVPPHFVRCNAPTSQESLIWIYTVLEGRFALASPMDTNVILLKQTFQPHSIYFEDPAEAMLYELRWS